MKWIRLLKKVDEHDAGSVLEVEAATADAYIRAGLAEASQGPAMEDFERALGAFRGELVNTVRGLADTVREANEASRGGPRIDVVSDEVERSKSSNDFIRQIVLTRSPNRAEAEAAHEKLGKVYGSEQRTMTEGTGTSFGYTTPTVYESQMLEVAAEEAVFVNQATSVPLAASDVEWPSLDQYQAPGRGQSAYYGGVQVYRKGESVQRTPTDPKTRKIKLQAIDLTALSFLSRNLIMDSTIAVQSYATNLIGRAIGFRVDWESILGSGEGEMVGLLSDVASDANGGPVMYVSRGTANTIKFGDLAKMRTRLLPQGLKRACWLIHPYSVEQLYTLTDPAGRYIYIPNWPASNEGPAQQQPGGSLLGLPVRTAEFLPPPGSPGELMLVDPKCYLYGLRSGLEIGLSEHFHFDLDEITIRAKLRNDGKPWMRKPIILADGVGTNKVSGAVVLQ